MSPGELELGCKDCGVEPLEGGNAVSVHVSSWNDAVYFFLSKLLKQAMLFSFLLSKIGYAHMLTNTQSKHFSIFDL